MKLQHAQLETHLLGKLSPIYIFSGDDVLLKQEAVTSLRKAATNAGYVERVRLSPEAGFDWEQLYNILNSGSLLAEKRLIELDFRDSNPNKSASSVLQAYAENPSPNNILLIDISRVDDKIARSAWYKALEKVGVTMPIWPISREQMPQWIINRARRYKIQMNISAANLLTDYVEGNLLAAAQAIEKIYLLRPNNVVNIEFITTILNDESHFTIFDFIENLIAGDKTRSLHILQSLQAEGLEPTLVLWGITRELRLLADLFEQKKAGVPEEQLFKKYHTYAKRQLAVKRFLNRYSIKDCWTFLRHAAEIDKIIKGAVNGDSW